MTSFAFAVRRFVLRPTSVCVAVALACLAVPGGGVRAAGADQWPPDQAGQDRLEYDPAEVDWSDEVPAHISDVDGAVVIEREGRAEDAVENTVLLAGDRLRTDRGRAEVLFADGSTLAIDEFTTVDLLDDALMRLGLGRIRLTIARGAERLDYRVDTEAGSALIESAGDYRLTVSGRREEPELDLAVLRGAAELVNDRGRTLVRAGLHARATAFRAPSLPYGFNAAAYDAFDRWAEDQRQARMGYTSTRYLPAEVSYYAGAFDRYGAWDRDPTYGYVWYPRVVSGWRPYSTGRWSFYARFGWTWIGDDRWSWPTHHYGRWGYAGSRWFWIPERRWAPAWVAWASAPGYVGWCPLGWNGRPIISITYINTSRSNRWDGWHVMPSRSFGAGVAVARHYVPPHSLSTNVTSRFAERVLPAAPATFARAAGLRAPTARGVAVSRRAAPSQVDPSSGASYGARAPRALPERGSTGSLGAPSIGELPSRRSEPARPGAGVEMDPRDPRRVADPRGGRTTSPSGQAESRRGSAAGSPAPWPSSPPTSRTVRPGAPPDSDRGAAPEMNRREAVPRGRERVVPESRGEAPRPSYRTEQPAPPSREVAPPSRRSEPSAPPPSSDRSNASRRGGNGGGQVRESQPSSPPPAAAGGGNRRQAPPSSSRGGGGQAVRRGGG